MATRLSQITALAENPASDDFLMVVDKSDTTSSADGTSKKIDNKYIIQTDKLSLVAANFNAMDDTGAVGTYQELVQNPGSGYAIIPLSVLIITKNFVTAETSNNSLYFGWSPSTTTSYWKTISRWNGSVLTVASFQYVADISARGMAGASIENLKFYMFANNNFNGNYGADVYTTYQIVKL
tara:strand:- start:8673 stop:9215 length:543 start_codon:yes stop_codon:yes gene_type:complete